MATEDNNNTDNGIGNDSHNASSNGNDSDVGQSIETILPSASAHTVNLLQLPLTANEQFSQSEYDLWLNDIKSLSSKYDQQYVYWTNYFKKKIL